MKSSEYWQKRSEEVAKLQYNKTDEYIEKLRREYDKSIKRIEEDISIFYQRYANNNEISMVEARKLLTGKELNEFKMTLEEFIEKAKDNADGRWTQQLNNVYYKSRISRLDALQIQMRQQVEMLSAGEQKALGKLLGDVYEDTYYRTLYEIQKGTGIGASFAKASAEKVLTTKWVGDNYSGRIWSNRDKLAMELETKLSQSIIRGDSIDRTTRDLAERMNVSYSNAARVVRTESSYIANQATADGYKASGIVQEYEYLATLDSRTSDVCQSMDGHVFNLNEKNVGINYPPLHANCRSTVVPYFEDEEPGKRIARDKDGKTYYVDSDTTYKDWYNEYVKGTLDLSAIEIGKSLGSAAFRDVVKLPNGQLSKISEGTKITKVVVFAGKGTDKPINVAKYLSNQYNVPEEAWRKVRGEGYVDFNEAPRKAELHWFEANGVGRIKMKVKRWFD